jgi:tetratricopeptide (TPR) repeat protein
MAGEEKPVETLASDSLERLERYRRAAKENPSSATAHLNLGTALLLLGRRAEAEVEYGLALAINPDLPEALVNLGGLRLGRWDFQGCVEANRRAAERNPALLMAHFNQGLGHLYLGQAPEVVACFRRVLEIDPGHAAGHYYLAVGLLATGQVPESRSHLQRAIEAGHSPEPEFLKAFEREEGKSVHPEDEPKGAVLPPS